MTVTTPGLSVVSDTLLSAEFREADHTFPKAPDATNVFKLLHRETIILQEVSESVGAEKLDVSAIP